MKEGFEDSKRDMRGGEERELIGTGVAGLLYSAWPSVVVASPPPNSALAVGVVAEEEAGGLNGDPADATDGVDASPTIAAAAAPAPVLSSFSSGLGDSATTPCPPSSVFSPPVALCRVRGAYTACSSWGRDARELGNAENVGGGETGLGCCAVLAPWGVSSVGGGGGRCGGCVSEGSALTAPLDVGGGLRLRSDGIAKAAREEDADAPGGSDTCDCVLLACVLSDTGAPVLRGTPSVEGSGDGVRLLLDC